MEIGSIAKKPYKCVISGLPIVQYLIKLYARTRENKKSTNVQMFNAVGVTAGTHTYTTALCV